MKKAVILFNLGGPDKLESIEPFLFNLFNDPAIISIPSIFRYPLAKLISKRRTPIAKNIYKEIGNKSPILELTKDQAKSLESSLSKKGDYKCFVVMRCWHPRAADIIKKAMIDVQEEMTSLNLESRMLLQVHDELVFDMKKSEKEILMKIVKEKMEQTITLDVPLVVDIGFGENWLEAH